VRFLDLRARELKLGGRLVIQAMRRDERDGVGIEQTMDVVNQVLQGMTAERLLRENERERMVIPAYPRTLTEFKEPFEDGTMRGVLTLEETVSPTIADPFWSDFRASGDREAETALFSALDPDPVPERRKNLAEDRYEREHLEGKW